MSILPDSSTSVRPDWIRHVLDHYQALVGAVHVQHREPDAISLERLAREPQPATPLESLIMRGLLAELILRAALEAHALPDSWNGLVHATQELIGPIRAVSHIARHPTVNRVRSMMLREYGDPHLRLTRIARALGVTPAHLSRLLHAEGEGGFVSQLHRIRLAHGARLLLTTMHSVKQIAAMVGYNYATDFGRHFRQRYGMSPSAWRHRQDR